MKKILLLLFSFFLTIAGSAQTPSINRNFVMGVRVKVPGMTADSQLITLSNSQATKTIMYLDGWGRPQQTVNWMASASQKDLVSHIEYDGMGRESKKYLPYADNSQDGSYKTNGQLSTFNFYNAPTITDIVRTTHPYAETSFEVSEDTRLIEQGAPGSTWQLTATNGDAHTIRLEYGGNIANSVLMWGVNSNGANANAHYPAGTLSKIVKRDENIPDGQSSGTIEEYYDGENRLVLQRRRENTSILNTYYVYDIYGDLRYVLPPTVTSTTFIENSAVFLSFIYSYKYDSRGRLIERKSPGKDWEEFVYNKLDQPILYRDGNRKIAGEWIYNKNDAAGRVVEVGVYLSTSSRTALQTTLNNEVSTSLWESRPAGYSSYGNVSFPRTNKSPRVVNYYDDYTFSEAEILALQPQGVTRSIKTKGVLTGRTVYRDTGGQPLVELYNYDDFGRMVQKASQNHLGGTDHYTSTFSFGGEVLTSQHVHRLSVAGPATTILTTKTYDHTGRVKTVRKKVNTQPEILQTQINYNEIGQIKQKQIHSENDGVTFLTGIDYAYNERGWLKSIASPQFSEELRYQDPDAGGVGQYNGNISEQHWGHNVTGTPNRFRYGYDDLNQLVYATSTGAVMSESIEYDLAGNITSLTRDNGIPVAYSYTGHQLTSLSGGITGTFSYDANGNALSDRTATTFTYNYLNLPITAVRPGSLSVYYLYNALGTKLSKAAMAGGTPVQRDYVSDIEYNKVGTAARYIERITTEDGYLQNNGGTYVYHYNLVDHLGNVRSVIKRGSTPTSVDLVQQQDYYAFGKRKGLLSGGINKYLYNGKEMQEELGGGTHSMGSLYTLEGQSDYGARFYDAEIGRWNVIDPLAEKHYGVTGYHYVLNNPLRYIDPLGLDTAQVKNTDEGYEILTVTVYPRTPLPIVILNNGEGGYGQQNGEMQTAKYGYNIVSDIGNAISGTLEGAQYRHYLGTIQPSPAYGFKVYMKPILKTSQASPFVKKAGYLGHAANLATVGTAWAEEGHFGQQTKVATAKALTGWAGAWAGAKIGATAGGIIGAPAMGIGAAPAALIGGILGAVVGGWGGSAIAETIYEY
ncbi:DUF6443 domain-containing protein [Sphingobacterium olei]|nr:DUF6443 domain-containing protein [Sphingobacterium olei]